MKKALAFALAMTMAATSLVGCGSKKAETEAAKTTEAAKATEKETEASKATEKETEASKATEKETEAKATEKATEAGVETEAATEKTKADGVYKAAFLIPGTLGDKSFWDSGNEGLTRLKEDLGEDVFDFKVEQMGGNSADMANYEPTFLDYCESGEYDVIITGSWQCMDALVTAIDMYPDQKFILFDEEFDFEGNGNPDNIYNLLFKQNEVSYLVGVLGAKMTESNMLCFLGGMDGKVINDFLVGYIQGAADTNPDIKVAVSMVGNYEDSAKGKDLSLAMYNAGADYGFNVAGNAGLGLIEAAAETGKMAFGVDSDQAALLPDYAANIPTSALKNVGDGLYATIQKDMAGELNYGTTESMGFAENGVALVEDAHYEEMVPEDVRAYIDEVQQKISDGEIVVYTSADMTTDQIEELKASVAVQ